MIVWSPIKYNLEVCDQYIVDNEFVGEIRSYRILNQMKRQTVHLAKAVTFTVFISDYIRCGFVPGQKKSKKFQINCLRGIDFNKSYELSHVFHSYMQ